MHTHIQYSTLCVVVLLTTYTHAYFNFFDGMKLFDFAFQNPFDVFTPNFKQVEQTPPTHYGNFDYIIVGAGAAGCPLAYTLAEAGYSTLLLERGMSRQDVEARDTLSINGLSNPVNSPLLSQLVVTPQGVRTHIANVLGGGSSLNLGIYAEENTDYYKYLETFPDVQFDYKLLNESTNWVYNRTASPMPYEDSYGLAWRKTMEKLGYTPHEKMCVNTNEKTKTDLHTDKYYCEDGTLHSHSRQIMFDKFWGGMSFFNASENFFRSASDVLLFHTNGSLPNNLHILTEHNVERVLFNSSGPTPKAECVEFRFSSKYEPIQIIESNQKGLFDFKWDKILGLLFKPFETFKTIFDTHTLPPLQKACINKEGEIILSSGAIMSSVILFKSGVGPSDVIDNLKIKKIKEIPALGKNFSDRIFVPVGFFFEGELPPEGHFDGRICRGVGIRKSGSNCTDFKIGEENLECSLIPIEEFSGAEIGENIFYATRYAFPPEWRDHPILDILFEFFEKCSVDKSPFNSSIFKPVCKIIKPITKCLKKSGSNFYITSEPKSRGEVRLEPDGSIIADPKYLSHDQDLMDAVRGVAELTKQMNMKEFKPLLEKYHKTNSCPAKIYNGILELVVSISSTLNSNKLNLNQVIPLRTLLEKVKTQNKQTKYQRRLQNDHPLNTNSKTSSYKDEFSKEIDYLLTEIEQHLMATISLDEIGDLNEIDKRSLYSRLNSIKKQNKQWAATFPPTLPDVTNPMELASYAMTYMSSVWHHSGSASFGQVVDNNFKVKGIDGLSIVDASNLNQMTRLNPSATIMMLGRYAGTKKVQNRVLDKQLSNK